MSTLEVSNLNDGTTTVATTFVTNGSAKAWLEASSSASLNNSYNISSGTDNGTGNYTYAFTSSFSGNWSPSGIVTQNSSYIEYLQTLSAGSGQLRVSNDGGSPVDSSNAMTIHGDLA
tara:strand:+ start:790 stop:1140 length:351 start_codon:yes stop_codon:yes gene_type:complete